MGHKCAQFKNDAKKVGILWNGCGYRFRLWASHGEICLAILPGHDNSPMALGNRHEGAAALTLTTPDRVDKRRVRQSLVENKLRVSVFHGSVLGQFYSKTW